MRLFPLPLSRRQFLFGGAFAGFGYMRFVESQWLSVGRHQVRLPGLATRSPLTLLHLSDFHASSVVKLDYINRAVTRALAACRPDLICLTGDFITSNGGIGRVTPGSSGVSHRWPQLLGFSGITMAVSGPPAPALATKIIAS